MRGKHGQQPRAGRHYRWNDGGLRSTGGYRKVRVGREHPLADANGYAYEHLLVWVAAGNARPASGFLLWHVNGEKRDNRLSNLRLLSRAEHNRLHHPARTRDAAGRLTKHTAGRLLDGVEHSAFPGLSALSSSAPSQPTTPASPCL